MKDNKWKCPKCGRSFSRTGQGHYCGKVETIDEYIDAQDESVKPYLNEIRQILRSAIPEAQEKISWSMPTYWKGANIIHFAASKKNISDSIPAMKPLLSLLINLQGMTWVKVLYGFRIFHLFLKTLLPTLQDGAMKNTANEKGYIYYHDCFYNADHIKVCNQNC